MLNTGKVNPNFINFLTQDCSIFWNDVLNRDKVQLLSVEGYANVLQLYALQPTVGPSYHMLTSGEFIFNFMSNTFLLDQVKEVCSLIHLCLSDFW